MRWEMVAEMALAFGLGLYGAIVLGFLTVEFIVRNFCERD